MNLYSNFIRLASILPKGHPGRRSLLAFLQPREGKKAARAMAVQIPNDRSIVVTDPDGNDITIPINVELLLQLIGGKQNMSILGDREDLIRMQRKLERAIGEMHRARSRGLDEKEPLAQANRAWEVMHPYIERAAWQLNHLIENLPR